MGSITSFGLPEQFLTALVCAHKAQWEFVLWHVKLLEWFLIKASPNFCLQIQFSDWKQTKYNCCCCCCRLALPPKGALSQSCWMPRLSPRFCFYAQIIHLASSPIGIGYENNPIQSRIPILSGMVLRSRSQVSLYDDATEDAWGGICESGQVKQTLFFFVRRLKNIQKCSPKTVSSFSSLWLLTISKEAC